MDGGALAANTRQAARRAQCRLAMYDTRSNYYMAIAAHAISPLTPCSLTLADAYSLENKGLVWGGSLKVLWTAHDEFGGVEVDGSGVYMHVPMNMNVMQRCD